MTPDETRSGIETALEGHDMASVSAIGGTGFVVDDHMVVVLLGDQICLPADPNVLDGAGVPFEFAGRPVAGWTAIAIAELDPARLALYVETAMVGKTSGS